MLGASGAVGQELLQLLEERNFPVAELRLLASVRSAGSRCKWRGQELIVRETTAESFQGVDLVLASAGGSVSKTWREEIVASGALMVDNSSAFRMEEGVPLVVPEVNPTAAKQHKGVIANPNCTTILLSLALAPLVASSAAPRAHQAHLPASPADCGPPMTSTHHCRSRLGRRPRRVLPAAACRPPTSKTAPLPPSRASS